MIAIHSLDNSIEYLLRIIIKHLEIGEKLPHVVNASDLMSLFSGVDKFLKEYTLFDGRSRGLSYKNEVSQLRTLRNNVQHGMILPINELKSLMEYGNRFFERVLERIFGLAFHEITYSTLIENPDVKSYLTTAEEKIVEGSYLEAIVACRDAFELGKFMLENNSYRLNKMVAIPYVSQESMSLYDYIQSIDEEIELLGTHINLPDYRRYLKYITHIPEQYSAIASGYLILQREWEKRDAEFCYVFVSQAILNWQLIQETPLCEIDRSGYSVYKIERSINETVVQELYPDKICLCLFDNDRIGELLLIDNKVKEELQKITAGAICKLYKKITNKKTDMLFSEHSEYCVIDAREFSLVLNNGPLWELIVCYRIIPFTRTSDLEKQIDIDNISNYTPKNENEGLAKSLIMEFGAINSAERAFELDKLLRSREIVSSIHNNWFSSNLIAVLQS